LVNYVVILIDSDPIGPNQAKLSNKDPLLTKEAERAEGFAWLHSYPSRAKI
jgi:hypothetical protein